MAATSTARRTIPGRRICSATISRPKRWRAISNAETGLFRLLPLEDGTLIAFEYTSKGFVPACCVPGQTHRRRTSAVKYLGQATLNKYPAARAGEAATCSGVGQFGESDHAGGGV